MLVGCFRLASVGERRTFTDFVVRDDGGGVAISVSVCQLLRG